MKRGCFVVVEPIEEGNKVKAEIVHILLPDQIKYIKEEGKWWVTNVPMLKNLKSTIEYRPLPFQDVPSPEESAESNCDSDDDLLPNPNRPQVTTFETDEDTSDENSEEDEVEEEKTVKP